MTLQVELERRPACGDGYVSVWVKIRGLKSPVDEDKLGDLCRKLVIEAPWGDREVTFYVSVPRAK